LPRKHLQKRKRNRALTVWRRWGDWRKVGLALITALLLAALMTVPLLPDKVSLQVGEVAREDITAPRYVQVPDSARTDFLKQLVAANVPRSYSKILGAAASARESTLAFFDSVDAERANAGKDPLERRVQRVRQRNPDVDAATVRIALSLSPEQLSRARINSGDLVDEAMKPAVLPDALPEARREARRKADERPLEAPVKRVVREVVAAYLLSNQSFNREATEADRNRAQNEVQTQYETISRGDVIVRKGEQVNEDHIRKLRAVGLMSEQFDLVTTLSLVLMAFGLVAVFSFYLHQFHLGVFLNFRDLLLLGVTVCGCMLLFRVGGATIGLRASGDQLGFLGVLCSALGAMLIAGLLSPPQIAVPVGVALGLLTSVLVDSELKFAIIGIVSSLAGVQAVSNIRNRAGILRACLTVSAVNVLAAVVAHGATQRTLPEEIPQNLVWAVVVGVASVLLWMLFTAWLERPFRMTTHLTLLELSDPSHPLLRRLAMEAPGTHSHSIIVGNLSEAAAEAIGADGLFCRVASYYHDVGKIIRPHFFVENQLGENRHNSINPSLSSLIVTSHVKDGVELAEEHRLPPPIIAIIREHHGTCLVKYFYHQAVTTGGEESTTALEYQFRYEGPRPQTKESGIIMLADAAEAASRTLDKPTPGRIRDLIERILRDRLADGQMDECELTFKDLEKIITSMTRSLTSLLHARVEYPSGDTAKLRRVAADGAAGKESVRSRKAFADTPETASGAFGRPPAE
jgi:putative nucleotidyltransferase with HDIG domain